MCERERWRVRIFISEEGEDTWKEDVFSFTYATKDCEGLFSTLKTTQRIRHEKWNQKMRRRKEEERGRGEREWVRRGERERERGTRRKDQIHSQ